VARQLIERVLEPCDQTWRGLGVLPAGGLRLRPPYDRLDAARLLPAPEQLAQAPAPELAESPCISGRVLQGLARPSDCPSFGVGCTPDRPLGAPMVSSEGACAAYHRYRLERVMAGR
jgi:hydrogenase expression/formation protein HypD